MMRTLTILLLLAGTLRAAEPWAAPDCPYRVRIEIPAQPDGTGIVALRATGADLWRWTGLPRPPAAGCRLFRGADALPLQVEELNDDGVLDVDDELLFTVTTGTAPTFLHLYYGGPPAPALPAAVTAEPHAVYGTLFTAAGLTVGVRGGGLGVGVHDQRNFARGNLCYWKYGDWLAVNVTASWGNSIPHAVFNDSQAPPWTEPEIVAAGPVRTVVRLELPEFTAMNGETELWRGGLVRTIAVWAATPVVDVHDTVRYTTNTYEYDWGYNAVLRTGATLDPMDVLLLPLAGAPREWPVIPDLETYAAQPYYQIYDDLDPDEGWMAYVDRTEHHGMGIFYERLPTIAARQRWVTYRPALHHLAYARTTPGNALEIRLNQRDRALRCRPEYTHDLRYVALADHSAAAVHARYLAWSLPLDEWGMIGKPEDRP